MSFRAQVFSKTFAGAGTVRFPGGRFFRLITAAADVTLVFYSPSGEELASIAGVRAGLGIKAENLTGDRLSTFGSVDVTSATAQAVAALISSVEADYDRSAGTVDLSGGTIDAVTLVRGITPPSVPTTPYFRSSVSAALNTVVAPAANTAGVRVLRGYIETNAATAIIRLMMKQTAPTSIGDTTAITLEKFTGTANAGGGVGKSWEQEFIVPAGWGLYEQSNDAANASGAEFGYTVL